MGLKLPSSTDLSRFFNAPQFEAEALEALGLEPAEPEATAEPETTVEDPLQAQVGQVVERLEKGQVVSFDLGEGGKLLLDSPDQIRLQEGVVQSIRGGVNG
jgi:hypothetical protein